MRGQEIATLQSALQAQKSLLEERLGRIKNNVRRGFDADSGEMAKELEDREVVDALGNEALVELREISGALQRIANGDYGLCCECGEEIPQKRLRIAPMVKYCIDCAVEIERIQS
jgi:RNA polymerase-binding transcription factor DksA